jgi:cytochrome c-type biogenesis protein CcmE
MKKTATRAVISAVVLFGAFALLMYTTMSSGAEAYKHVDEVSQNPAAWYGKPMQLHGTVAGQIWVQPNTLDYQFDVNHNGKTIHATYTGVVPDTFKTGSEVVLKGRLSPAGFKVEPDGVMAKCPSKYTPGGPATQAAGTNN